MLANVILWPWAVLYVERTTFLVMQALMSLLTIVAPASLVLTLKERGDSLTYKSVFNIAASVGIGIGLMVNNTLGQLLGYFRFDEKFARTPKRAATKSGKEDPRARSYSTPLHWTFAAEILLIIYCVFAASFLIARSESLWALPLILWAGCLGLVVILQIEHHSRVGIDEPVSRTS